MGFGDEIKRAGRRFNAEAARVAVNVRAEADRAAANARKERDRINKKLKNEFKIFNKKINEIKKKHNAKGTLPAGFKIPGLEDELCDISLSAMKQIKKNLHKIMKDQWDSYSYRDKERILDSSASFFFPYWFTLPYKCRRKIIQTI